MNDYFREYMRDKENEESLVEENANFKELIDTASYDDKPKLIEKALEIHREIEQKKADQYKSIQVEVQKYRIDRELEKINDMDKVDRRKAIFTYLKEAVPYRYLVAGLIFLGIIINSVQLFNYLTDDLYLGYKI